MEMLIYSNGLRNVKRNTNKNEKYKYWMSKLQEGLQQCPRSQSLECLRTIGVSKKINKFWIKSMSVMSRTDMNK